LPHLRYRTRIWRDNAQVCIEFHKKSLENGREGVLIVPSPLAFGQGAVYKLIIDYMTWLKLAYKCKFVKQEI